MAGRLYDGTTYHLVDPKTDEIIEVVTKIELCKMIGCKPTQLITKIAKIRTVNGLLIM